MSEVDKTPTRQFIGVGDVHHSADSSSDGEVNLQSQLLDRRLTLTEVNRKRRAIVDPLAAELETLIQLVRQLSEKSSKRPTDWEAAFERSRSLGQRSDPRKDD